MVHHYQDLIDIFNALFQHEYDTILVKGGDEPLYLPKSITGDYHQVIFAHGYYASALHEVSHWCIAGPERRLLEDYGYWYVPDGRTAEQQQAFERVEVKPQAVERCFCLAAGCRFHVSADNLRGDSVDTSTFERRVLQQSEHYLRHGLPPRAQQFYEALRQFYQGT